MREKIAELITGEPSQMLDGTDDPLHEMDVMNNLELADQIIALTVGELKKEIEIKRDYAFTDSGYGSHEHHVRMDAMVNAYDVVLKLIKGMVK